MRLLDLTSTKQARCWHAGFAAFSVLAALVVAPWPGASLVVIRTMAVVGYALALCVSVVAVAAPQAPRVRRLVIGFHLAFVPLQFLFAFPNTVPQLGLVASVLIVIGTKPRFPRLSRRARAVWLTLHVGISVGWLGLAVGMTTLALTGLLADDHALRHGAYEAMHVFDLFVVIPSMLLGIITGLVVSLGGKYGLVKHRWVLTKFVIALSIPAISAVENGWVRDLAARTTDPDAEPGGTGIALAGCMVLFTALLWTATVLSVTKPWGRTRWGRRELHTRSTAHRKEARV